jgi:hypothetical protein
MGGINLSALVFALVVVLWLVYALPGIVRRRDLLGEVEAVVRERGSESVQVLSAPPALAGRHVAAPAEPNGVTMSEQRVLASREKFAGSSAALPALGDGPAPLSDASARAQERGRRQRQVRTVVLLALAAVSLVTVVAALVSALPLWVPLTALGALALFVVGLRRAEVQRLEAMRRVEELRAEIEANRRHDAVRIASPGSAGSADEGEDEVEAPAAAHRAPGAASGASPADRAAVDPVAETGPAGGAGAAGSRSADSSADRTWTPVPVPTPSYLLKDDAGSVYERLAARRSAPVAFESADVEDQEWADEVAAGAELPSLGRADLRMAPQERLELDFDLDQVLARRRA